MTVKIKDLLLSPRIRDSTFLVAGTRNPSVNSVRGEEGSIETVSRRLAYDTDVGTKSGRERAIVLVLLTPVPRFDARFDVLLRRAALTGVVAVALGTTDTLVALAPGIDELATRLGISLLVITDPWEFSVQLHMLIGEGELSAAGAALGIASIGLSAGPSLDEAFTDIERSIGYPLEFLDAAARPLRGALDLTKKQHRELSEAFATETVAEIGTVQGELIAIPVTTGVGSPLWIGVLLRGRMQSERAMVTAALRVASVVVGHRLMLMRLVDERDARYRTSMLEELRSTPTLPPPSLVQRTITAGWRLDEWHIGIRLVARDAEDFVALRPSVESAFAEQELHVEVVEQIDGWALWLSKDVEPTPAFVRDAVAKIRQTQLRLQPTVDTNIGVGSVQAGATGLLRTLAEAGDAARIAAGRTETGHFVHVDSLGLAQLLLAWTQTDTFLPAAHQLLAPLSKSASNLLETLRLYLDTESSLAETSTALGVHRNTIADRISRIERLLDVDLRDAETRLALHLAVRTTMQ